MSQFRRILKYEFLNVIRNHWVFVYSLLLGGLSLTFLRIAGDAGKALVTLSNITSVLVPLVSILFSTLYWYYSDRFTELLLTQPIKRATVYWARCLALSGSLGAAYVSGLTIAFAARGEFSGGLLLLNGVGLFLTLVFVLAGILISVMTVDRMRGMGMAFALWFYFAMIHDGVILLMLLLLRDYPLDLPAAVLGTLNPVGLSRVILLVHHDASLLLGHTGALVRNLVLGPAGVVSAVLIFAAWISLPTRLGFKRFEKRDF